MSLRRPLIDAVRPQQLDSCASASEASSTRRVDAARVVDGFDAIERDSDAEVMRGKELDSLGRNENRVRQESALTGSSSRPRASTE